MKDNSKELLRYPLRILQWCGQNPEKTEFKYLVSMMVYLTLMTTALTLTILQFVYANGNIVAIAYNCEALMFFGQNKAKFLIIAVKTRMFRKMIHDTNKFWRTDKCTKEIRDELENNIKRTLDFQKLYVQIAISAIIFSVLPCAFMKQLPTGFWTMVGHDNLYTFAQVLQGCFGPWVGIYGAGCDSLFLSFCVLLRTQFQILHQSFKDLKVAEIHNKEDAETYSKSVVSYIEHHNFLLRFSNDIRKAYSPIMMSIYSSLIIVFCAEMYVLFENPSTFRLVRHALVMVVFLFQLSFYCIPLNYLTDEAVSISQGIYESDWYSKRVSTLKTVVPLIIQRSHKEIIFMAGGLVEMNCRTVLNVVRTAYSVCAIMRAMKTV